MCKIAAILFVTEQKWSEPGQELYFGGKRREINGNNTENNTVNKQHKIEPILGDIFADIWLFWACSCLVINDL